MSKQIKGRGITIAETRAGSGNEEFDARLIAAAPELLEALKDMLNAENTYPYGGMSESEIAAIQKARAAIAKAEEP